MQTKELIEYKAMIMTTRVDIESKSSLVTERFNWESIAHATIRKPTTPVLLSRTLKSASATHIRLLLQDLNTNSCIISLAIPGGLWR